MQSVEELKQEVDKLNEKIRNGETDLVPLRNRMIFEIDQFDDLSITENIDMEIL